MYRDPIMGSFEEFDCDWVMVPQGDEAYALTLRIHHPTLGLVDQPILYMGKGVPYDKLCKYMAGLWAERQEEMRLETMKAVDQADDLLRKPKEEQP